jgi:dihydroflavonol-4-reductase
MHEGDAGTAPLRPGLGNAMREGNAGTASLRSRLSNAMHEGDAVTAPLRAGLCADNVGRNAMMLGDEDTPVSLADMVGDYKRSKYLAEQAALEFARGGLPVVIVNPTAPVGDHDVKPTPTGKIVLDFLNGGMPAFIDTGLNIVDVRDTALGHLLACEHGRSGERYILGAENLTLAEILQLLAKITGRKAPTVRLPYAVAYCAGVCSTAWASLTGKPPRVPLNGVRMGKKKMWVSHEKASRELGFSPGPAQTALARAVAWFTSRREPTGAPAA